MDDHIHATNVVEERITGRGKVGWMLAKTFDLLKASVQIQRVPVCGLLDICRVAGFWLEFISTNRDHLVLEIKDVQGKAKSSPPLLCG